MATISGTSRPGYVWDSTDNVWYPIGTGVHTHDYIPNSIADAKGDLFVASADNTVTRLAVGSTGDTIVADSSTSTGLRYQGNYAAGKNRCLNGDIGIWQRGTSFTANSIYGPDRWFLTGVTGQMTFTQVTSSLPSAFQYAIKLQRNSGSTSTDIFSIAQAFETSASIPLQGQTVTLSFYAKAGANLSGANIIRMYSGTGINQAAASQFGGWTGYSEWQNTGTFTATSTWTRFTTTGTVPSNATQIGFRIGYSASGTAGADDSLQITGVQLEIGSTATAFQTATGTIQGELAACQRYYFRANYDASTNYVFGGNGGGNSTTQARTSVWFPVMMRTKPTVFDYATISKYAIFTYADGQVAPTAVSMDTNLTNSNVAYLAWTASSGLTANALYYVRGNNDSSAYLGFGAEL